MMTIGPTPGVDPESFVHSKYILLWACNTLGTNSHHWPFIEQAKKAGAKLVVIDPVRTRTARLADWHIPIRPGTDAALALAMIHVIIKENLVDRDYIDKHTVGYDELAERASTYTPEFAAQETGIPVEDIVKLAREYATTPPAVVRIGVAVERHAGGGQTVRAIACLPGLIGAWKHVGGGLLQLPIWAFPVKWEVLMRPDLQPEKMRVLNSWRLGPALTGELGFDPPIKSLFVYNANPMAMVTEQAKLEKGLEREDLFTVVSEHFLTDTARYADIVLPATTQLEQKDIMFSWGHLYLSYNNPAIEPLGEAVPNTELFRRLAKAMGIEDPSFYRTDDEMIEASLDWTNPVLQGITLEDVKAKGYARLTMPSARRLGAAPRRKFSDAHGQVRIQVDHHRRRQFRRAAVPPGLQRRPGRHAGGPLAALHPAEREPADDAGAGKALSAQPDHAEEPRVPELELRQSARANRAGGRGAGGVPSSR